MSENTRLKNLLTRKMREQGYSSVRSFAQSHGMPHAPLIKAMNGKNLPTRRSLDQWCAALNCSHEEIREAFHASGYFTLEEIEVQYAA